MAGAEVEQTQSVPTGIEGLDAVLQGGLPAGQFYLVRGPSGAGKTTLGLQFLREGARRGEAALYLSTTESEASIRRVAASHGWSLDGVTLHQESPVMSVDQTILEPAEAALPQTLTALRRQIDAVAPVRLVIDSLDEIRALARDELWYRRQLIALKRDVADRGCTVLLVEIQRPGGSPIDSLVDGVIELVPEVPRYGSMRRRLQVGKVRAQEFVSGYHDFRIVTGGLEVYPRLRLRLVDDGTRAAGESISSGIATLDGMLGGGLTRGDSHLILGPGGTGKSILTMQIAAAAAGRGEPSLVCLFDERADSVMRRGDALGLDVSRHVAEGGIRLMTVDPVETTIGEFSHHLRRAVERDGVRNVALDSLNGYGYAVQDLNLLSVHLHRLADYLGSRGVTIVLTMSQDRAQDGLSLDLTYLADCVIALRYFRRGASTHKALSVLKNRAGPHSTEAREFTIGPAGLSLAPITGEMVDSPAGWMSSTHLDGDDC